MGSCFVASEESSAHIDFKKKVVSANEGDTLLSLKKIGPVRLLKNSFFQQVKEAEDKGASDEELRELLGRARAKKGMFEGDLEEGELEIGQISGMINDIKPAGTIVKEIWDEYVTAKEGLNR